MQNCMPLLFLRLSCLSLIMPARSLARILGKYFAHEFHEWTRIVAMDKWRPGRSLELALMQWWGMSFGVVPSRHIVLASPFRALRTRLPSLRSVVPSRHLTPKSINVPISLTFSAALGITRTSSVFWLACTKIRAIRGQKIVICGFSSCILALFYSVILWLAFLVCFI